MLINRVDIKNERSALVHKEGNTLKGFSDIINARQMIDAVKNAYGAVNRAVKVDALHFLIQKQNLFARFKGFLPCGVEHSDAAVNPDNIKALLSHFNRHTARSAAEVKQNSAFYSAQ